MKIGFHPEQQKKVLAFLTIVVPLAFTILAVFRAFTLGVSTVVFITFLLAYILTAAGLEIGYHRLFSHKSYRAKKWLESLLAILGTAGGQGPVFYWVSYHRTHHRHTDEPGDPHSPHVPIKENGQYGLVHAHLGWLISVSVKDGTSPVRDLQKSNHLRRINKNYLSILLLTIFTPAAIVLPITDGSLSTFIDLVLWAGFVKITLAQHTVWAINSMCHSFGRRSFKTRDDSRNLSLLALLMWGAGWHNNHHAFPYSYHLQMKKHQLDPGRWLLELLEKLGWVWDLKAPSQAQIQAKTL